MSASYDRYSAAVSLCELWEREGNEILKPLTHDPGRSETILLAARRLGDTSQSQSTLFVRAILESNSEYEDVLHRDLFLAARCLGNGVCVDRELRAEVVERLCNLYFDSKSPSPLREDIRKTFALLGAATACDDLVEILLGRLPHSEWDVRIAAADALRAMGERAARKDVIAALLERLSDAEKDVRYMAAGALGSMGETAARENVIVALLERLSGADEDVRCEAARALGWMGEKAARENVIAALLERMSDREEYVWSTAASALGALTSKVQSYTKPAVIKLVLPHARDKRGGDKNEGYRRETGYLALRNLMSAGVREIGEGV